MSLQQRSAYYNLIEGNTVPKEDHHSRGWYLSAECGVYYLYTDGTVRFSVTDNINDHTAFWPTEEECLTFYKQWVEDNA